jgi:hypothetical protein
LASPGHPGVFCLGARFGALEVQIAEPAVPPLRQQNLLVGLQQLGNDFLGLGVAHDRADRHAQNDVVGCSTKAVGATSGLAVARSCRRA